VPRTWLRRASKEAAPRWTTGHTGWRQKGRVRGCCWRDSFAGEDASATDRSKTGPRWWGACGLPAGGPVIGWRLKAAKGVATFLWRAGLGTGHGPARHREHILAWLVRPWAVTRIVLSSRAGLASCARRHSTFFMIYSWVRQCLLLGLRASPCLARFLAAPGEKHKPPSRAAQSPRDLGAEERN